MPLKIIRRATLVFPCRRLVTIKTTIFNRKSFVIYTSLESRTYAVTQIHFATRWMDCWVFAVGLWIEASGVHTAAKDGPTQVFKETNHSHWYDYIPPQSQVVFLSVGRPENLELVNKQNVITSKVSFHCVDKDDPLAVLQQDVKYTPGKCVYANIISKGIVSDHMMHTFLHENPWRFGWLPQKRQRIHISLYKTE